jgi:hypothetical protein
MTDTPIDTTFYSRGLTPNYPKRVFCRHATGYRSFMANIIFPRNYTTRFVVTHGNNAARWVKLFSRVISNTVRNLDPSHSFGMTT